MKKNTDKDIEKLLDISSLVTNLTQQLEQSTIKEDKKSESAQAIAELNRDDKDSRGWSTIDQRTDITHNQAVTLTKLESLSRIGFFSEEDIEIVTLTFQRKMVSLNRKGRGEAIQLHQQIENKKDGAGFWERWFSPKQ